MKLDWKWPCSDCYADSVLHRISRYGNRAAHHIVGRMEIAAKTMRYDDKYHWEVSAHKKPLRDNQDGVVLYHLIVERESTDLEQARRECEVAVDALLEADRRIEEAIYASV